MSCITGTVSTVAAMSKLSHITFCTFLCEMQRFLSREIIFQVILNKQFSEWGAILLCEEVRSTYATIELFDMQYHHYHCCIFFVFYDLLRFLCCIRFLQFLLFSKIFIDLKVRKFFKSTSTMFVKNLDKLLKILNRNRKSLSIN